VTSNLNCPDLESNSTLERSGLITGRRSDISACTVGAWYVVDEGLPSIPLDFRALFENAPGLYLVLAPDFKIVAVSEAYLRATMTRRDAIVGRGLFEVFPDNPEDPAADGVRNLRASLERVLLHNKPDTMAVQKYDIRRPDSEGGGFEERHWSPVNSPVLDSAGQLTHIIHRVEDVTEFVRLKSVQAEKDRQTEDLQRRATAMEAEIFQRARELAEAKVAAEMFRQSEARLRELADVMPQIVWAASPDGTVDYYNRRWYEFTGRTDGESVDQNWGAILHPDDLTNCHEAWTRSVSSGTPYEIEYRFKDVITGGYRWFLGRALPVLDAAGKIVRWYGTCTDIDARKLAQEDIQQAREAAEAANQSKDRFLAVLSHELRTPLTPVLLTVSLLENDPQVPLNIREDIRTIRRNVELEARLIDDLLDLTRVTRGKMQLHFELADVHDLIRNAVKICFPDRAQDVTLALNAKRHHVRADPARLQQVFWNLLGNAGKFTPVGKPITIRSRDFDGGKIRVEVIDNGIGISAAVLPAIFNAFEQGDNSLTRKFGGLGLGLTISSALIDAHGGSITAHSDGAGKGATFTVELQTVAAPKTGTPVRQGPRKLQPVPARLQILLVEDHPATLDIMKRLLTGMGYDVKTAASVKGALAVAEQDKIDLVISDLGLPDGSGNDVMRALQQRPTIRGIALSGYGMDDDIRESKEAGFDQHLTKPVDMAQLQSAIQQTTAYQAR